MILFLVFIIQMALAAPIPPPLEGWEEWILKDQVERNCPAVESDRQCRWMGKLTLDIREDGATYTQQIYLDTKKMVQIVGGSGMWPFDVKSNGVIVPVVEINGRPRLLLEAGSHIITGELDWLKPPSSVPVPYGIAQIDCRQNGQTIESQYSTTEGQLRIGEDAIESQIQIRVLRRIQDGHPTTVETHIWMTSTGGHKPIDIGNPFLEGTHPLQIDSRLGTQLTETQNLIVQPLPGEHKILIHSIFPTAPSQLVSQSQSSIWPQNEHWVFLPNPAFRTLQISGAQSVDRERASLPEEWPERSVYQVAPLEGVLLSELHRGDPQPPPNQLQLRRQLWLDSDGSGVSIRDEITGQMSQGWRLGRSKNAILGSFNINNQPQVITNYEEGQGVEIRHAEPIISAESRVESLNDVSTVGWNIQPESLYVEIHLPPGWELIRAGGGAHIDNGFWNNTLLLKIILIFSIASIIGKLSQKRWGIILGLALLLYTDWSMPILLYTSGSLIILAYKNKTQLYVWFRWAVLFFFIGYILDLCYTEAIDIFHPTADSTQVEFEKELRYSEIIDYGLSSSAKRNKSAESWQQNIPNAIAQTGMGTPNWNGDVYNLSWNDKWIPDVPLNLVLLSPSEKRLLDCLRLFLLCYGLWQLLGIRLPQPQIAALFLLAPTLGISNAHAEPPEEPIQSMDQIVEVNAPPPRTDLDGLLDEYTKLLLAPPACGKDCLSTSQLVITIEGQSATLQAEIHALVDSYWLVPGTTAQINLTKVLLNGQPTIQLHQDKDGRIAIRIPKGVSVVEAEFTLLTVGATPLDLHQKTQQLNFKSSSWTIEGLRQNMVPEPIIKIIPEQASSAESLQPHSILHRHFDIGHQWRIENTLQRNQNTKGPLTVSVPLLNNEQVLDPNVLVTEGTAVISLTTEQTEIRWTSQLPSVPKLDISAGDGKQYIEQWTVICAVMHHCTIDGIVASQHITDGLWTPLFQPQPNEQLTLSVQELSAAQGQIRTIEEVQVNHHLGASTVQTYIELNIRAATEGNLSLDLPNRQITSLMLNGVDIPIVQDGEALQIPHSFGENKIQIDTSMPQDGWFQKLPALTLPTPAVNIGITLTPSPHWLIHFFAPAWGSKSLLPLHILFWLLFAFVLAKIPRSPLTLPLWLILFLITIPMPVELTLILSAPLLMSRLLQPTSLFMKSMSLFCFALFIFISVLMLTYAILEPPNLITTDALFSWRIDRSDGVIPSISVFQLPRFSWKILALLWAGFVGRIVWKQGDWLGSYVRDIVDSIVKSSKPTPSVPEDDIPAETSDE